MWSCSLWLLATCLFYQTLIVVAFFGRSSNPAAQAAVNNIEKPRVAVAGATGYIGRVVVQELVRRGYPTAALVRDASTISSQTSKCIQGAELIECNVCDESSVANAYAAFKPSSTICCLASRSGTKRESFEVDYGGGKKVFLAQEKVALDYYNEQINNGGKDTSQPSLSHHYVLLSAYCVGKPLLQFQLAKLQLEREIQAQSTADQGKDGKLFHSIVRPTAFFKSIDGQIESAREGLPVLYFGDGTCAANPICEEDLANYLIDCAVHPRKTDMLNKCRDVGGPDVPPITKKQQIEIIYDTLGVAITKRWTVSIPVVLLDFLINTFSNLEKASKLIPSKDKSESFQRQFEDAAEIVRIVRYYATEPMVAIGPGSVQGKRKLADHFQTIAARGGTLEEVDKMVTTTGILELFLSKKDLSDSRPTVDDRSVSAIDASTTIPSTISTTDPTRELTNSS